MAAGRGQAEKSLAAAQRAASELPLDGPSPEFAQEARRLAAQAALDLGRRSEAQALIDELMPSALAYCERCRARGQFRWLQAQSLRAQGKQREAFGPAREAVDILAALDGDSPGVARWRLSLASLLRSLGEGEQAEAEVERVRAIYAASPPATADLAQMHSVAATIKSLRDDDRAAVVEFRQAWALVAATAPESDQAATLLSNLGTAESFTGDHRAAREHLAGALDLLQRRGDSMNLARALMSAGQNEAQAGDRERALVILDQAMAVAQRINGGSQVAGRIAVEQAMLASLAGDHARAVRLIDVALATYSAEPADCLCRVPTERDAGYVDLAAQRPDEARRHFDRALAIQRSHAVGTSSEADVLQGLGELELAVGASDAAERQLAAAAAEIARVAPGSELDARNLYARGRLESARSRPAAARERYCAAVDLIDRISTRSAADGVGQSLFRARFPDVYRACVEEVLRSRDESAALTLWERARARGFFAAMEQRELDFGMPESSVLREWRRARDAYAKQRQALADGSSEAAASSLRRLLVADAARGRALAGLRSDSPRLASLLPWAREEKLPLRRLPSDAAFVSYVIGAERGIVFVATRTGVTARRLPVSRADLERRVRAYRGALTDPDHAADSEALGQHLYEDLVSPIEADVAGSNRLIIAPDGPLYDMPFAALRGPGDRRFLIERWVLALSDSLRAYATPAAEPRDRNAWLAVADPDLSRVASGLPELPAARDEVRGLRRLNPGNTTLLIGGDATETSVRLAAGRAGVLHFAVHAQVKPQAPLESALLFARGPQGGDDGALHAWEIIDQLRLPGSLVVLSACDTARGEALGGEGLLGLTRAFAYAGSRATMASLWPVADRQTADFMLRFYAARPDRDAAAALRDAMLATMKDRAAGSPGPDRGIGGLAVADGTAAPTTPASPYFWASFVIYDQSPAARH